MSQRWLVWLRGECQVQNGVEGPVSPTCPCSSVAVGFLWSSSMWDRADSRCSGATPAQGTAEHLSNAGGVSVGMCLEEQKILNKYRRGERKSREKAEGALLRCMSSMCTSVIEGDVLLLVAHIELYLQK